MVTWRNWAGSARCRPERIVRPRTEQEVAEVVAEAVRRGRSIRAAGTGHSFNAAATTEGVLVDLTRLAAVESVEPEAGTVTVAAGIGLDALNRVLDRAGLALPNLGTLTAQTVGGAMATATTAAAGGTARSRTASPLCGWSRPMARYVGSIATTIPRCSRAP